MKIRNIFLLDQKLDQNWQSGVRIECQIDRCLCEERSSADIRALGA